MPRTFGPDAREDGVDVVYRTVRKSLFRDITQGGALSESVRYTGPYTTKTPAMRERNSIRKQNKSHQERMRKLAQTAQTDPNHSSLRWIGDSLQRWVPQTDAEIDALVYVERGVVNYEKVD